MDTKMMGLLALDLLGALVFVVGAIGMFGDGSMLPKGLQFPGHNLVLMAVGLGMMWPYMSYVLRKGAKRQQSDL